MGRVGFFPSFDENEEIKDALFCAYLPLSVEKNKKKAAENKKGTKREKVS